MRRGHIINTDDLDVLREIGKSRIHVLELAPDELHEDDAAEELALMLAGRGVHLSLPGEAWADLVASSTGLLKVDRERLLRVNLIDGLLAATRHDNSPVRAGDTVVKAEIRDLAVRRAVLEAAREAAAGALRDAATARLMQAAQD